MTENTEVAASRSGDVASSGSALHRATIEDVAALAKVSVATVSRALRGLPNVADTTRQRVSEAAETLNYRADPNASRLAAGRTMTIGMAVPILGQWYFAQIVAGAASALGAAGYDLLLMGAQSGEARRRFIQEWALIHKRVDGLILVDLHLDGDEVDALQSANAIVSTVGDRYPAFSSITIDNRTAARRATEHLIALGHRRIGFIGTQPVQGRDFELEFSVPVERRNGYRDALAAAGIALDPAYEVPGDFTIDDGVAGMIDGGATGMARLLALPEPPTAVFAMTDETAFGALRTVRQAGLRVPDDVSVIGFDDHEVSEVLGLTTIRQPVVRSGVLAAQHLIAGLTVDGSTRHAVLEVELVARSTTAAPRR
jgi:DNA-binding LacI/PurR family transcriptional regulator